MDTYRTRPRRPSPRTPGWTCCWATGATRGIRACRDRLGPGAIRGTRGSGDSRALRESRDHGVVSAIQEHQVHVDPISVLDHNYQKLLQYNFVLLYLGSKFDFSLGSVFLIVGYF